MINTIFILQLLATGNIVHSRNVSFNEKEFLGFGSSFPEDCEFFPEPKSSLNV